MEEWLSCIRKYSFQGQKIPDYMHQGLANYIVNHMEQGDFLNALLSNDLLGTFRKADDTNMKKIQVYVAFLYNEVPAICWGSREKVEAWINQSPALILPEPCPSIPYMS